ncbi:MULTISPECIES: ABC transporter ATP-binding protein [unclassified Rathayibacter]|uniref:ABC transporter ATP-binding protein n=1 Tax=unclassified Rathayibacter TaxID=2609250 RepID=UPI00104A8CC2|nr:MULTISPECIES: ABC transporter ATP-binding protein [unclassified Rathayibacter]TCL82268.1 oligopeptide transport system ATP-binding protein [Rathayibacter sp. PhB192]TCM27484.1 oligopeptide transport system ATP-binding protein [Rathayibacter sp. PhB179]
MSTSVTTSGSTAAGERARRPLLSVRDLAISFENDDGAVEAIRGLSFDLHAGEVVAIVGESGSGKSVTARAILGLMGPSQRITGGSIEFSRIAEDGSAVVSDIAAMSERAIRREICGRRIAMVFQDALTCLDPTMSVGKQVMEGIQEHFGLGRRDARARAIELLAEVGIDQPERRFKQFPHQLSGGMCQRVNIAIALSCNPDVLICDEPTTALDVTIQLRILELLKRLQADRGLSVIFITHDLGVVATVADHVNVMYAGRIIEQGTAEEVFYDPRHPYTWGLLSAMPDLTTDSPELFAIPGSPASLVNRPAGDPFAQRNPFALEIDFVQEPPLFDVGGGHRVASWLCHPDAPPVEMPAPLRAKIDAMLALSEGGRS